MNIICRYCGFPHATLVAYCTRCERPLRQWSPSSSDKTQISSEYSLKKSSPPAIPSSRQPTTQESPVDRILAHGVRPRGTPPPITAETVILSKPKSHSGHSLAAVVKQNIERSTGQDLKNRRSTHTQSAERHHPPPPLVRTEDAFTSSTRITNMAGYSVLELPAWWRLLGAMAIDALIWLLFTTGLLQWFGHTIKMGNTNAEGFWLDILSQMYYRHSFALFGLGLGWLICVGVAGFLSSKWGYTVGQWLFKLRLLSLSDGSSLSIWRAGLRAICLVVGLTCLGITFFCCFLSRRRRTLHDALSGSMVVSVK